MEQVVLWYVACDPGLWLADIDWIRDPGHRSHSTLFPMELWVLSYPDLAVDLSGGAVFPGILLFQGGVPSPAPDPGHPSQAAAIYSPAMRGGADSYHHSLPVYCRSGHSILCIAVWVDELWRADFARSVDAGPAGYLLPRGGPDVEPHEPCSDLPSHGGSGSVVRSARTLSSQLFAERVLLSDPVGLGYIGPGVPCSRPNPDVKNPHNPFRGIYHDCCHKWAGG